MMAWPSYFNGSSLAEKFGGPEKEPFGLVWGSSFLYVTTYILSLCVSCYLTSSSKRPRSFFACCIWSLSVRDCIPCKTVVVFSFASYWTGYICVRARL